MFFGQKLKEIRLEQTRMGLRKFAKKLDIKPSEYYSIERGYSPPPADTGWFNSLCEKLDLFCDGYKFNSPPFIDYLTEKMGKELLTEWRKPFVMQKMEEGGFPVFPIMTDGHKPTNKELVDIHDHIKKLCEEHNKKADEYNKANT